MKGDKIWIHGFWIDHATYIESVWFNLSELVFFTEIENMNLYRFMWPRREELPQTMDKSNIEAFDNNDHICVSFIG